MKKFDYREYIQDNWLLKEAKGQPATASDLKGFATKDSTLNREKRAKEGNWRGSIGKYVEAHGAEINAAASSHQLRNFVVNTMKPTLGPEAQEYLDDLLANCNSDRRLLQALYNVALKGNGMGLHESDSDESENVENAVEYLASYLSDYIVGRYSEPIGDGECEWPGKYPSSSEYPYGRIGAVIGGLRVFLGNESPEDPESPLLVFGGINQHGEAQWREMSEQEARRILPQLDNMEVELFDPGKDW